MECASPGWGDECPTARRPSGVTFEDHSTRFEEVHQLLNVHASGSNARFAKRVQSRSENQLRLPDSPAVGHAHRDFSDKLFTRRTVKTRTDCSRKSGGLPCRLGRAGSAETLHGRSASVGSVDAPAVFPMRRQWWSSQRRFGRRFRATPVRNNMPQSVIINVHGSGTPWETSESPTGSASPVMIAILSLPSRLAVSITPRSASDQYILLSFERTRRPQRDIGPECCPDACCRRIAQRGREEHA